MNSMKPIFTSALTYGRNIGSVSSLVLVSLWMILAAGCATLRPDFVTPSVNVTSFKPLSSETFTPRFEFGMRVVNPNSSALNLRGMSYKLYLNDFNRVLMARERGIRNAREIGFYIGRSERLVNEYLELVKVAEKDKCQREKLSSIKIQMRHLERNIPLKKKGFGMVWRQE